MAKTLRNTTNAAILVIDTGVSVAANTTYMIPPSDYPLWAASTNVDTYIDNGNFVVNDGYDDLKIELAKRHMHEEGVPRANSFIATAVVQATAASTLTLTATSRLLIIFTGSTAGQIVKLPNATTLNVGHRFELWNTSTKSIAIQNNGATAVFSLLVAQKTWLTLQDNSTTNGVWLIEANFLSGTGGGNGPIGFGFDGNVAVGRWLESFTNIASNLTPIVVGGAKAIRAISAGVETAPTSVTITIFKNGSALDTIVITGGAKKASKLNLNYPLTDQDTLTAQVTALTGSTSRPVVLLWL